jgi:two-component system, NarL family, nitrate/nitrite response regulator NarL
MGYEEASVRTTSTVVVANRALLREGIASLLHKTAYEVVAAASRPTELEPMRFAKRRPVLAIVGMDDTDGTSAEIAERIALLRSLLSGSKVVVVAETSEPIDLDSVTLPGADGYIVNLGSREILLKALELTLLNQQVFVLGRHATKAARDSLENRNAEHGRDFGNGRMNGQVAVPLSHRESEVLICLARGQSNKAIARLCHISEATVKVHLKAILRKTNARNRTQAAIWAIEHGFRDSGVRANAAVALNAPNLSPAEPARARLTGDCELAVLDCNR